MRNLATRLNFMHYVRNAIALFEAPYVDGSIVMQCFDAIDSI